LILIRLRCQGEGENKSEKSTIKPKRLAGPHQQQKRHVIQIEKSKKNNNSNNNQTARQRAFSVHTAIIAIARFFIFSGFVSLLFDLPELSHFLRSISRDLFALKKRIQIFFFRILAGDVDGLLRGKLQKIPATLQITAATSHRNHVTSELFRVFFNFPYFSELLEFYFFPIMSAVETDRKGGGNQSNIQAKSSSAI
jgi:hypothetical protein